MKNLIKILIFSCAVFEITGCEKEVDLNLPVAKSNLVVEGWIEQGRGAMGPDPQYMTVGSRSDPQGVPLHAVLNQGPAHIIPGPGKVIVPHTAITVFRENLQSRMKESPLLHETGQTVRTALLAVDHETLVRRKFRGKV